MLHQPTCADELSHARRKYDEEARGVEFDLERFTEDVIDEHRAELLGLDPLFYEIARRVREQTIATEGAEG